MDFTELFGLLGYEDDEIKEEGSGSARPWRSWK